MINTIKFFKESKQNPDKAKIKKLDQVITILNGYIKKSKYFYLFKEDQDGFYIPYFVNDIEYEPPSRYDKAHVVVTLSYYYFGEIKSSNFSYYREDAVGKTARETLDFKGYTLETDALFDEYVEDVKKYKEINNKIGKQFLAEGHGSTEGEWSEKNTFLETDGQRARVVVNTDLDIKKARPLVSCNFWDFKPSYNRDDDEEQNENDYRVPLHAYIQMYNLNKHYEVKIHVRNLEEYVYDKNIGEKLVIPKKNKDLIEILIEQAKDSYADIIKGKGGGSIILCSGPPGTGKTLTAEVYAEIMERPLYIVQSSQLGIKIKELEEILQQVLRRTSKWNAILLIDEADVYVYERDTDIEQNAVVGIFLRVLEYFNGILFFTTNRTTQIDDAIVSRVTAKIAYDNPDLKDLKQIWRVLAKQNGVELEESLIDKLVEEFKDISGRDVKNLLKLAMMMSRKQEKKISLEMIKHLSQYKQ